MFEWLNSELGYWILVLFILGGCLWSLGLAARSNFCKILGYTAAITAVLLVLGSGLLTVFPSVWLKIILFWVILLVFAIVASIAWPRG